ncbi:hypothetical protein IV500_04195 [Paeniglutamicibacter antarcticus]|uniref:Uncharacterized protein n=1 Tax=Arthrobacter terrae TaxID=2935737 RepID=A0A931CMH9_9MICC|nr:hypothetical protein [Arthrobacter terrae]MBG0738621.1 hypothetical protein [Arthrobacter terrae]
MSDQIAETDGPEVGMWPFGYDAKEPVIPYSERIFAASAELHAAYARDEPWTRQMPLSEASVLLVTETIDTAIWRLINTWRDRWTAGDQQPFPAANDVHNELIRIVALEGKAEQAALKAEIA